MKLIALIAAITLAGCLTQKKATDFLKKKDILDDICAETYPVRDTIIQGDTVLITDTLESFDVFRDTTVVNDTVRITTTLPPKIITRTKTVTETIVRENTAKSSALEGKLLQRDKTISQRDQRITELNAEYESMKEKRDKWRLWFWVLVGALGLYVLLKVKRILPF